jgi:hypothetical protein
MKEQRNGMKNTNNSKFYLDCEFLEGTQKTLFGSKTKPTIDLISIGLVSEDGREYYAISKDFNLKEAWNRYDLQDVRYGVSPTKGKEKVYWIRENVLKPLYRDLLNLEGNRVYRGIPAHTNKTYKREFCFRTLKYLIKEHGKTNRQIANEICEYIYGYEDNLSGLSALKLAQQYEISDKNKNPEFYTYYGAYDWVVFCWLFGKMIDLPKGFPMYTRDLKQILDEKVEKLLPHTAYQNKEQLAEFLKTNNNYPPQENEHNALADARWNKKLYEFLQTI